MPGDKWLQLIERQRKIQDSCFAAKRDECKPILEPRGYREHGELKLVAEIALPALKGATDMGLLQDIGRVWAKVETKLYVFDPHYSFQSEFDFDLPIVGVGLVKPKEGTFRAQADQLHHSSLPFRPRLRVPHPSATRRSCLHGLRRVQVNWLLVVTTHFEAHILEVEARVKTTPTPQKTPPQFTAFDVEIIKTRLQALPMLPLSRTPRPSQMPPRRRGVAGHAAPRRRCVLGVLGAGAHICFGLAAAGRADLRCGGCNVATAILLRRRSQPTESG
jgi:hypothetical protein